MTAKMKVVFAGTPEFAAVALRALLDAGFEVPLVLTQPDRPAGRGMQLQASAVKQVAVAHGIPVLQPLSLRMDAKDPQRASEAQAAHERLLAVCIQHEMDHLMGKVFVEYLSPLKRNRIKTKLQKEERDMQRSAARRA